MGGIMYRGKEEWSGWMEVEAKARVEMEHNIGEWSG